MIISVAVQAYLARIGELLKEQGFDPSMSVIYDAEQAQTDDWISDELAGKHMERKQMTTKEDVRKKSFMALFWTRSSLEPIIRHPWRLLDTRDDGVDGRWGKSTVNGKFRIACAFVSNKANTVEDLEEAFAARFQSTYNVPLSLEFIYNAAGARPGDAEINFTMIQNMGESNLLNYKEGNLFSYAWSAEIYLNYVSEFAWSQVFPVEKVLVDLYDPKGIPLASLDAYGKAHTHTYMYENEKREMVEGPTVPDEPLVAFTSADPRDYALFSITLPYSVSYPEGKEAAGKEPPFMPSVYGISDEARELIGAAIKGIGGEVSLRSTKYMMVVRMPLALNHKADATYDADLMATAGAVSAAIHSAASDDYIVTPMPPEE